ncbi:MAG: S49 family peptidase [Candidatus Obscuribacter sp.]|nr:S49 family peptidase [Candidatus Obscuribacter sp.]MBK9280381.1 S49 family peptidase [Candidatus Obscuribacter sp.]
MMEFLTSLNQAIQWVLSVGTNLLVFILLSSSIMLVLALTGLVAKRSAQNSARQAFDLQLVKLNNDFVFTPRPALANAHPQKKLPKLHLAGSKLTAVLKFEGDTMASGRQDFARMVDELLINKDRLHRAIVVVNSPGGGVSQYGQMYAEMERIRAAGIDLTACVDTYAASGGYLMSVPAHRIVAAPFSMVGSVGVVSEFINFNRLLKGLGADPLTLTAGNMKRTVTPLSEVTEDGKQAYLQQLAAIHRQFIAVVKKYRNVDETVVCNGNHWTAAESVEQNLNLVDELATSQDYLFRANQQENLVFISKPVNPYEKGILSLARRITHMLVESVADRFGARV